MCLPPFVQIYGYIALWLTNMEKPRTRTDFEDSYTMKLFCFQFINYYSSLVYIAFFKVWFLRRAEQDLVHKS